MSVSYMGQSVIGCEITSKVPKTEMTRSCMHRLADSAKFCSECGKPSMAEVRVHLDDLPLVDQLKAVGMRLARTTDDRKIFAGVVVSGWGDVGAQRLELDFGNVRMDVQAALEPLGLWSAESFGLWIVMYCSY